MEMQPYRQLNALESSDRTVCLAIYVLFLFSSVTGFVGPLVGFIFAKYQKTKVTTELGISHLNSQIDFCIKSVCWAVGGIIYSALAAFIIFNLDLEGDYDIWIAPGLVVLVMSFLWFLVKSMIGVSLLFGGRNA